MRFLQFHHYALLLFILVPILIHFFKRMQAQRIVISSLYLLRQRKANLSQKLKLRQIILLITRSLIVTTIVVYFMQPILMKAPSWLHNLMPYQDQLIILLDNRWDDRETMISEWYKLRGQSSGIKLEFLTLYQGDKTDSLYDRVIRSISNVSSQSVLFSRFYGVPSSELNSLNNLNIQLIAYGPEKVNNLAILGTEVTPSNALLGENIKIIGTVQTNAIDQVSTKLSIFEDGKQINEQLIKPSISKPSNFSFSLQSKENRPKRIMLKIPPDILEADDEVNLKIDIKGSLSFALVDDKSSSRKRDSRLFYVRQFIESLKNIFPNVSIRIMDFNSQEWLESKDVFDWLIVGHLDNFIWKKNSHNMLLFAQSERSVQAQIDTHLGIKSYAIEALPKEIQFSFMSSKERNLYQTPWQAYRYLQLRLEGGSTIAFSGSESLIFEKNDVYFCAFDFGKYDFSGIAHPYFPVFLYQLFLNRFPETHEKPQLSNQKFERDSKFSSTFKDNDNNPGGWTDLSSFMLVLFLSFLLIEIYLITSIQSLNRKSQPQVM